MISLVQDLEVVFEIFNFALKSEGRKLRQTLSAANEKF